mgnify:CR=1 FL=1
MSPLSNLKMSGSTKLGAHHFNYKRHLISRKTLRKFRYQAQPAKLRSRVLKLALKTS